MDSSNEGSILAGSTCQLGSIKFLAFTAPIPLTGAKWGEQAVRKRGNDLQFANGLAKGRLNFQASAVSGLPGQFQICPQPQVAVLHASIFPSWRQPQWYGTYLQSKESSWQYGLRQEGKAATSSSSTPSPPPWKRKAVAKVLCTVALLSSVTFLWASYVYFSLSSQDLVKSSTTKFIGRNLKIGRLLRLSPSCGVRVGKTEVLRESKDSTAPEIIARSVDIWLPGLWRAVTTADHLLVNVRLNKPIISVRQRAVMGPKNKVVAQWDPGLGSVKDPVRAENVTTTSNNSPRKVSETPLQVKNPPKLQPGTLYIEEADVILHTAVLPGYGHGGETVEIRHVRGSANLPKFAKLETTNAVDGFFPFKIIDGLSATVAGVPAGGGSIEVSLEVSPYQMQNLSPGDEACNLYVTGNSIKAEKIAAFLSLPFRANSGTCQGKLGLKFYFRASSFVPETDGNVELEGVSLRLHPDPKTPEFSDISGMLRFKERDLFLDGPKGNLGTLPMTVVGNIDLVGEYNLIAYIPSVDVNNILDTFDVERFVPVTGHVQGEARLTGLLEEPCIVGWAETSGSSNVFDRLPVERASVDFEWDAMAGILKFNQIDARVKGEGTCRGQGGLYFDMTKETPFGINRLFHHHNSPKALYWNNDSGNRTGNVLPLEPEDELEIDDYAAFRPYDSMYFEFCVEGVSGSELLKYYGGKYGNLAYMSVGKVNGNGVIAGRAKNANCRVSWRSVSPPPAPFANDSKHSVRSNISKNTRTEPLGLVRHIAKLGELSNINFEDKGEHASVKVDKSSFEKLSVGTRNRDLDSELVLSRQTENSHLKIESDKTYIDSPEALESEKADRNDSTGTEFRNMLGGGDFQGLVYIKLGDLPAARRVKIRTTIKAFDARRILWGGKDAQPYLVEAPRITTSMDTYFKGVMYQRPIIPPGATKVPRTPRMELLGADGALAVRRLGFNNITFPNVLVGSFSFSTTDISLSLKELSGESAARTESGDGDAKVAAKEVKEDPLTTPSKPRVDEITVSASLRGDFDILFRQGNTELAASSARSATKQQVINIFGRQVSTQDFLGSAFSDTGNGAVSGICDFDLTVDIGSRRGSGTIVIQNSRFGPFRFNSVSSVLDWRDQEIYIRKSSLLQKESEYCVSGILKLPVAQGQGYEWDAVLNIPHASMHDISSSIQKASEMLSRLDPEAGGLKKGIASNGNVMSWFKRLSDAAAAPESNVGEILRVPDGSFEEKAAWFEQYLSEQKRLGGRFDFNILSGSSPKSVAFAKSVDGAISGKVKLRYKDRNSMKPPLTDASRYQPVATKSLSALQNLVADFELSGSNWRTHDYSIKHIAIDGRWANNRLRIGSITCKDTDGFSASASGYLSIDGAIRIRGNIDGAPAAVFARFSRAPINVSGKCQGYLRVDGSISNPEGEGALIWRDASLNGHEVQGARGDMQLKEGICKVVVSASVGDKTTPKKYEMNSLGSESSDVQPMLSQRRQHIDVDSSLGRLKKRKGERIYMLLEVPTASYWRSFTTKLLRDFKTELLEDLLDFDLEKSRNDNIRLVMDVEKYGLVFLHAAMPELGWISGSADIKLEASGSMAVPAVKGRLRISDGKLWPSILTHPIEGIRGDIIFDEVGTLSMRSLYAKCNGKGVFGHGDILLSEKHGAVLNSVASYQKLPFDSGDMASEIFLESAKKKPSRSREKIKAERQAFAQTMKSRVAKGLTLEFGEVALGLKDTFVGKFSGKFLLRETLANPEISGTVSMHDGIMYLSNPASMVRQDISKVQKKAREKMNALGSNVAEEHESQEEKPAHRAQKKKSSSTTGVQKGSVMDTQEGNGSSLRESEDSQKGGIFSFRNLRFSLGRDVQIVYPFVLNLEAHGSLNVNGPLEQPRADGKIYFSRGQVNMLASRMNVKRDEESSAKFDNSSIRGEPFLNLSLEDEDIILRIQDGQPSNWPDHLSISTKRGDPIDQSEWAEVLLSRLEFNQGGSVSYTVVPKLLASTLMNAVGTKGKVAGIQWRLFPAAIGSHGEEEKTLGEQFGGGAQLDLWKSSLSFRKPLSGDSVTEFSFRPWRWFELVFEWKGLQSSARIEVTNDKD